MKATERLRARLHEVTQQFLRDLSDEMARMRRWKPKPAKSRVSPRKVKRRAPKQAPQREPLVPPPAPSNESAKPEPAAASLHLLAPSRSVEKGAVITASPVATVAKPAKREVVRRIGKSAPEPRRSEAFIGMPRPLAALKPLDELAERGRRGAEAAKASRATERALGPTPKLSKSDLEIEAWAAERLAAGDLPREMTFARDEIDEPAAVATANEDEEDEG